jgi:hypothetical protein
LLTVEIDFNPSSPPNKANQAELASTVFIGTGWAGEGYRAATALRYLSNPLIGRRYPECPPYVSLSLALPWAFATLRKLCAT